MRTYQTLDRAEIDADRDILMLTSSARNELSTSVAMRREGDFLAISCSRGALELALRLKKADVTRTFSHLQPAEGQQTPRQIGTGQAFLQVGLQTNGALLLRPVLVADAGGLLALNLSVEHAARRALLSWLNLPVS